MINNHIRFKIIKFKKSSYLLIFKILLLVKISFCGVFVQLYLCVCLFVYVNTPYMLQKSCWEGHILSNIGEYYHCNFYNSKPPKLMA